MIVRTLAAELEIRDADDGHTLVGLAVPYGVPTKVGAYTETMARGVFADAATNPGSVKVMAAHQHDQLPIGRALSLSEDDAGLHAELMISDTNAGRDVLTLVRDRVATGLSVGFIPYTDRWNTDRTQVTRTRATLLEVSVVAFPAYPEAQIASLRHELAVPLLAIARRRSSR